MNEVSRISNLADRSDALVRSALLALWSFVLPALLALVVLLRLVPTRGEASGTWAAPLGQFAAQHGLALGLSLFLGFSLIARYWIARILPGAESSASSIEASSVDVSSVGKRRSIANFVLPVAIAALLAVVLNGMVVGSYHVLSASMLPTLEPEDLVGGSKTTYGFRAGPFRLGQERSPRRGDIVVFDRPTGVEGPDRVVKRVIGLAGDQITMNGPHPVINGWEVPSCDAGPYVYPLPQGGAVGGRLYVEFLDDAAYLGVFAPVSSPFRGPYEVKKGEVFVLGDNRSNSSDSRSWNGGRGGGLPFWEIEARVKWWLLGVHRNGRVDLGHLGRALDLHPRLEGVDIRPVREGIERCLQNRPSQTRPPSRP